MLGEVVKDVLGPKRNYFHRHAEVPDPLDQFRFVDDPNSLGRSVVDDLFPEQGASAPLDAIKVRVNFIGPIDAQVDVVDFIDVLDRDAQALGLGRRPVGSRDPDYVQALFLDPLA